MNCKDALHAEMMQNGIQIFQNDFVEFSDGFCEIYRYSDIKNSYIIFFA
jgi:hypothetical protein